MSPSLLRVFVRTGSHHPDSDYTVDRLPSGTSPELALFVYPDSTLRELVLLTRDALPPSPPLPHATKFSIRLVYYDPDAARFRSTDLAQVSLRDLAAAASPSPAAAPGTPASRLDRTLAQAKYVVGDLCDIAILLPPSPSSDPAPGPPPGAPGLPGPAFGIRGAAHGIHPAGAARRGHFAPLHPGGPGAGGGGGGGAPPRADTWAPVHPSRAALNGLGGGGGGGGMGPRRGGPPPRADQGWGGGAGAAGRRGRGDVAGGLPPGMGMGMRGGYGYGPRAGGGGGGGDRADRDRVRFVLPLSSLASPPLPPPSHQT